jgi:pimeloyl-ACP methyl ester carboxylesterase
MSRPGPKGFCRVRRAIINGKSFNQGWCRGIRLMPDFAPNPEAYPRLRLAFERWRGERQFRLAWPWVLLSAALLALFIVLALPYILPLGGPETIDPADLADPDGAFIEVEGARLYYTHTPGPGAAVVLIHGMGGSTVSWQSTVPALSTAGYDVYAVDLPGFGLSDKGWDADYSLETQAARVIGWLDALGVGQAHIVGHSMGGRVAAYLALAHPDRVASLTLVAGAVLGEHGWSVPGWALDLPFARRWARIGLRRVVPEMFEDLLRDATYDDDVITPALLDAYRRPLHTPEWDLGLLGIVRDSGQNDLPAPVSAIRAPTLLLWGAHDTWVSPADGVQLERLIPGARRITFEGAGHLPMHEAPDAFNTALLDFLDGAG